MADGLAEYRAATASVHVPGPQRMLGRQPAGRACLGCGAPWPCEHSWQARAVAAEARLAEIRQAITTFQAVRVCGPDANDLAEGIRQILDREPAP